MYCIKCGAEIADDSLFCSRCENTMGTAALDERGFANQTSHSTCLQYAVTLKSSGLAAFLSCIFMGLGQIYLGKITRGVCFILVGATMVLVFSAVCVRISHAGMDWTIAAIMMILTTAVIWIYNVVDAYEIANEYNDKLKQTGQVPW